MSTNPPSTISLSLISHTNVGKTTLARTLLRRDVGEVRDAAHVTELAEAWELAESPPGDRLVLWDTPGFGDSARLLRRLRQSSNPLGWFLTQVWDRYTDRPFFSSQEALRNVRDAADVVLYLVNASEDPAAAGYVDAEMQILAWIGKPVLVLLNQLGPPQEAGIEAAEVERWSRYLASVNCVREVIAFDAFARCWVQEHVLLDRIAALLPEDRREGFARVQAVWRDRNAEVFVRSMTTLADHLAAAAVDRVEVPVRSLGESARALLGSVAGTVAGVVKGGEKRPDPALERAMQELAARFDAGVRKSTDELIRAHGLAGSAAGDVLRRMGTEYAVDAAVSEGKASVLGAAVSGAIGGLAADLATGGLTFGAGALIGGLLGAAGSKGLARAYNLSRGSDTSTVRWSGQFLTGRTSAAILRYLAVAHFGRGRGDFVQGEYPAHWRARVESAVASRAAQFEASFTALAIVAASAGGGEAARRSLQDLLVGTVADVLRDLYPASWATLSMNQRATELKSTTAAISIS